MDLGHAIIKGVIQGLTEFLPVSSTAHLVFVDTLARLFGWSTGAGSLREEEFYDILLHLGTLLAVTFYFRQELGQLFRHLAQTLRGGQWSAIDPLFGQLGVSFIITSVLALGVVKLSAIVMAAMGWSTPAIQDLSDYYFHTPQWVAIHLVGTGFLLFWLEKTLHQRDSQTEIQTKIPPANGPASPTQEDSARVASPWMQRVTWPQAVAVGVAQGWAAIFHGFSRSGTTMTGGVLAGMDRLTAARYSFLLSIPTFMAVALYEGIKVFSHGLTAQLDWPVMLLGTVASTVVGYFCVSGFIRYVAARSLKGFAVYCWAMAALMLYLLSVVPVAPAG
ncbi:MAG: undecaprenyl-diphosphate phosphatase [Candidatus Melainabacteria bacterium]|nr:undecaprenyl-diphosphate phosphatase [Candidatus Melainabacteria bacterium]